MPKENQQNGEKMMIINHSLNAKILLFSCFTLIVASLLNAGLSLFPYERTHVESLVSKYETTQNLQQVSKTTVETFKEQTRQLRSIHQRNFFLFNIAGIFILSFSLYYLLFRHGLEHYTRNRIGTIILLVIAGIQVLYAINQIFFYYDLDVRLEELIVVAIPSVIISFLVAMELLFLLYIIIGNHLELAQSPSNEKREIKPLPIHTATYEMIRPVAFLLLFVLFLTQSFLPLYVEELFSPFWGITQDVAMGLPITMEMILTVAVLFPGGIWMEKRGWHEPFFTGMVIAMLASFLSGTATSAQQLILYRGLIGVGYGLSWMSLLGFVVENTTFKTKGKGIANVVAGIFSGFICGAATGAVLGEILGYGSVFYIVMVCLGIPILYVLLFMRPLFVKPSHKADLVTLKKKLPFKETVRLFLNRNVISVFLMHLIPTQLCVIGVLYYFIPIYLKNIKVPQSQVGIIFMIYGLCMIYVSPYLSKFIDKSPDKKIFITVGGIIGGVGICLLFLFPNMQGVMLMVLLLGISTSFTSSSTSVYILNMKVTHQIGTGKMMTCQRVADKTGAAMGPIILGALIVLIDINTGIFVIGISYFLATIVFMFLAESQKPLPLPGIANKEFEWKQFTTFFKNFGNKWYLDELSPEKKYGYAMAASLALVTAADGELQNSEAEEAQKQIEQMEEIQEYLSHQETQKAFDLYIKELMVSFKGQEKNFENTVSLLLLKIPEVEREEWKQNIIKAMHSIAEADEIFHESEAQMIQKVRNVLWKEEVKYFETLIASLVLVSFADGEIQESEILHSEASLENISEVQEFFSIEDAKQIFHTYVKSLQSSLSGTGDNFELVMNILLQQIDPIKNDEQRHRLIEMVKSIVTADDEVNAKQEQVLKKIQIRLTQVVKNEEGSVSRDWKTLLVHGKILVKRFIPMVLSPEKQYGNAIVAVLAIIACADRKLTDDETRAAYQFIEGEAEIKKYLSLQEARQTFNIYVKQLLDENLNSVQFEQSMDFLIQKIPNVQKEEWKHRLIEIAMVMSSADLHMDPEELRLIRKIGEVLWQSEEFRYGKMV